MRHKRMNPEPFTMIALAAAALAAVGAGVMAFGGKKREGGSFAATTGTGFVTDPTFVGFNAEQASKIAPGDCVAVSGFPGADGVSAWRATGVSNGTTIPCESIDERLPGVRSAIPIAALAGFGDC